MPELTDAQTTALACQRIEENAATKDPILDLGDLPLERLPDSIGKLDHLQVVALGKQVPGRERRGRRPAGMSTPSVEHRYFGT